MHDIVIRGGTIIDATGKADLYRRRSHRRRPHHGGGRQTGPRAGARSTPTGLLSRLARSTCIRIMTARRCRIRCSRRRAGMASRRLCSAIAASASRRCSRAPSRRADGSDGRGRGDPQRRCWPMVLTWEWETFPDFLDALECRPRAIDIARPVRICPAGLCHGRPRGAAGRRQSRMISPRCAASLIEALKRRRLRLHHLAHRFAQDPGRRHGAVAQCGARRASGHRLRARRRWRRRLRHEQRLRRRGV